MYKDIIIAKVEAAKLQEDVYIIKQKAGYITEPVKNFKGATPANVVYHYRHAVNKDVLHDSKNKQSKPIRKRKPRKDK